MIYHAKSGIISDMNYISFGSGEKTLIMLPGLGDGLSTVNGKAFILAATYRMYAQKYKVYIFSRKNFLPEAYSTRQMAKDQAEAMKALGLLKASVLGISQGGMIAQYLAIDYPDLIEKLILAVTSPKADEITQKVVGTWIDIAEKGDYKALMIDTAEKSYSEPYIKKYKILYPLLGKIGKPKSFDRFLIQANSCIQHNACMELEKIICPTFIIGGGCDKIVGTHAAPILAKKIKGSELFIYNDLGHAAYEEARDFNKRVLNFLMR